MNETRDFFEEKDFFCLTDIRQLIRILDFGLIVPELVAVTKSTEIKIFSSTELDAIHGIDGYPAKPVLLELDIGSDPGLKVLPVTKIKCIHFPDNENLDDFLAREFENVPNRLFDFKATPELFYEQSAELPGITLSKFNRHQLKATYREYDILMGLFWEALNKMPNSEQVSRLINDFNTVNFNLRSALTHLYFGSEVDEDTVEVFKTYLHQLDKRDIDEGWVAVEILEELGEGLTDLANTSDVIGKWLQYCSEVISKKRDMGSLTDDGNIVLRAILLHLFNPDVESIDRMSMREDPPGKKVLQTAQLLAASRTGFSPMTGKLKETFSGRFFLVSDMLSSLINQTPLDTEALKIDKSDSEFELLTWNDRPIVSYETKTEALKVETIQPSDQAVRLSMDRIKMSLDILPEVEMTEVIEDRLIIHLSGELSKSLPKQAVFLILETRGSMPIFKFSTRLLDLAVVSQAKKLNERGRLLDAVRYQSFEAADFRFEIVPEESFTAVVIFSEDTDVKDDYFTNVINRLVDCHTWLKEPIGWIRS